MKIFGTLISTTILVGTFTGAAWIVAPDHVSAMTNALFDRIEKIAMPDCTVATVACLRIKQRDLKDLQGRIGGLVDNVETGLGAAGETLSANRALLGMNEMFLEQGRNLLRSHTGGPILFANRSYPNRASFEDQLRLVFEEGGRLRSVVAEAEALETALSETRRGLLSRRAEVAAELAMMPSRIALAEAEGAFAEMSADVAQIDSLLSNGVEMTEETNALLRTTEELARAAKPSQSSQGAFEDWLVEGYAPSTR